MVLTHACVKFLDDKVKYYFVLISDIFYKKEDDSCIKPESSKDYEENHKYYVYWRSCGTFCDMKSKCCKFYGAYILSLGDSRDDANFKAQTRNKRLKLCKRYSSSSESSSHLSNEKVLSNKKLKVLSAMARKENCLRTVEKYKQNVLMASRKPLGSVNFNARNIPNEIHNKKVSVVLTRLEDSVPLVDKRIPSSNLLHLPPPMHKSRMLSNREYRSPLRSLRRSRSPSLRRSRSPSLRRTRSPSLSGSRSPSSRRSRSPSLSVSRTPSLRRSRSPSLRRTRSPSLSRSRSPSLSDSRAPSSRRSRSPSLRQTRSPSLSDSRAPSLRRLRSPSLRRSRSPSSRTRSPTARRLHLANAGLNETEAQSNFNLIKMFKIKLYRYYKREGLLIPPATPEVHERYSIVENMIYLGRQIKVGERSWKMIKKKNRSKFGREIAALIFKKRLDNICLDPQKTSNHIQDRSPMKVVPPLKLELYLSLFQDYLNTHPLYQNVDEEKKIILMKESTEHLSLAIRDARRRSMTGEDVDSS